MNCVPLCILVVDLITTNCRVSTHLLTAPPSTSSPDTSDRSVPGKNRLSWRKYLKYFTKVPADHRPPHALLCVELCVSAELHRTVFMTAQQHSSGSLDTCLRQKIAQNSGSLHVNSQDSGVTTKVLFLSTWPQFITTSLQSNNS